MSLNSGGDATQIHQSTLKGHSATVLCLAHSSDIGASSLCLLSGSEDGTCRLWDLRSSCRAALCIMAPNGGDVNSVAFGSPPENATMTASPFSRDFLVFLSVANQVYGYDLRKASAPIVREASYNVSSILENSEEVNQISLSKRGNQELHVAAADDGGTVRVTSDWANPKQRRRRILHHDPDGLAMVTCAEFRPKGIDLASGGTDCTIHLWDITRPRRPSSTVHISRDDAGANQVCNPPMVHSISWSPSGRLLAAGLGDGTCSVLRVRGRTLTEVGRLREGHDASVASVMFPDFSCCHESDRPHVALHDRLLVSAGNDGAILFWDLGSKLAGDGAMDPSTMFADEMTATSIEQGMEGMALTDKDTNILFGIPHEQKPNWLTSSRGSSPPSLFVADTTKNIAAYTLPIR